MLCFIIKSLLFFVANKEKKFEKRQAKKAKRLSDEAEELPEAAVVKKRKGKEKPQNWIFELALAFIFFFSHGFTPKEGAPGDGGDGPKPEAPARQQMRDAKKKSLTSTTSAASNAPRSSSTGSAPGPGSNGRDAPLNELLIQGASITAQMTKANSLMEREASLEEAKAVVSLISEQLKNPFLSEARQRALWKEHDEASENVRALLAKRKTDREAPPTRTDTPVQDLISTSDGDDDSNNGEDGGEDDGSDDGGGDGGGGVGAV
jgi:hypothetical protein